MTTLPKSRLVKVEFTIALPVSATEDEVEEWVRYGCGNTGGISLDNPLIHHEPEIVGDLFLTDTWRHLHSEAIDNQDGSFTIRRWADVQPAHGKTANEFVIEAMRNRADSTPSGSEG